MIDDRWDHFFLGMAAYMARMSKDPSTQTGAVIVRPDKTVASMGYNGFPKQMLDYPELYENREEKYSRIVHCEMNAILHSKEDLNGYILYTYPFLSCDRCAVHVIQSGISRVVGPTIPNHLKERWGPILEKSKGYFKEAGVEVCEY